MAPCSSSSSGLRQRGHRAQTPLAAACGTMFKCFSFASVGTVSEHTWRQRAALWTPVHNPYPMHLGTAAAATRPRPTRTPCPRPRGAHAPRLASNLASSFHLPPASRVGFNSPRLPLQSPRGVFRRGFPAPTLALVQSPRDTRRGFAARRARHSIPSAPGRRGFWRRRLNPLGALAWFSGTLPRCRFNPPGASDVVSRRIGHAIQSPRCHPDVVFWLPIRTRRNGSERLRVRDR